jgi:HSP20 family protein
MANLTRFDPFKEMALFNPFGATDDFFKAFRLRPWHELEVEPQIKIDVTEDDKAYTVKADVPGIDKNDIHVSIDGNQVSISAEIKKEKEEKKGEVLLRSERYFGKQYRGFSLAHDIDSSRAEAKYSDGVLQLTLPKKAGNGGRELKVS